MPAQAIHDVGPEFLTLAATRYSGQSAGADRWSPAVDVVLASRPDMHAILRRNDVVDVSIHTVSNSKRRRATRNESPTHEMSDWDGFNYG